MQNLEPDTDEKVDPIERDTASASNPKEQEQPL